MSRYQEDDYSAPRVSRRERERDHSPDYYSGGAQRDYDDRYDSRNEPGGSRQDEPFQRESMTLMPPPHHQRPRSVPPNSTAIVNRDPSPSWDGSRRSRSRRSRSSSRSSRRSRSHRDRSASTMSRARHTVEDNFTNSTAGLGASLLGAVVGGFVASKASDAAFKHKDKSDRGRHQRRHSDDNAVPKAVSTILGAVAGGLGANAIANRVEDSREHGRHKQAWESQQRSDRHRDDDYDYVYDDRRSDDSRHRRRRDDY